MNDMTCDPKVLIISPIQEKAALVSRMRMLTADARSSYSRLNEIPIRCLDIRYKLE